jgi:hypothetical protein
MLKACLPTHGPLGGWWNLKKVRPSGRKLGHFRLALKGDIGTPGYLTWLP